MLRSHFEIINIHGHLVYCRLIQCDLAFSRVYSNCITFYRALSSFIVHYRYPLCSSTANYRIQLSFVVYYSHDRRLWNIGKRYRYILSCATIYDILYTLSVYSVQFIWPIIIYPIYTMTIIQSTLQTVLCILLLQQYHSRKTLVYIY